LKELDGLKLLVGKVKRQAELLGDIEVILDLSSGDGDPELLSEAEQKLAEVEKALVGLEMQRMLSGENDSCGAILTINAGAGARGL
jgi:peptide chain release factor 2